MPRVFETHLKIGTEPRKRLNDMLLKHAFDERLEDLIANTDELVRAPYFWNAEVMPLCTKARIARDYKSLGKTWMTTKDGNEFHLYPQLLALLLRLASFRVNATSEEIARRTKEASTAKLHCPLDQACITPRPTFTHQPVHLLPHPCTYRNCPTNSASEHPSFHGHQDVAPAQRSSLLTSTPCGTEHTGA